MKIAKPRILLLGLLCFVSKSITSQDGIFAFAYNKEGKSLTIDSESSEYFNYKYTTANKVLDNLIEAKGTYNMPRPQLIMNNGEQKPAYVDLNQAQIVIEEKAYDICRSLGADSLSALSLLISHELIHYYEKHDWHNHFLKNYSNEIKASITEEALSLEVQADQMGGFLSKMAGYETSGVYEKLLTKIYEEYRLNGLSDNGTYPSLKERIGLSLKADSKLSEMNIIFDMSNQLNLIGEYELASDYLDYILIKCKFQSRELHNNKGILMAFSALPYFSQKEMPYVVPFEIDVESRVDRKNADLAKRKKYIDLAMQSFKTALLLDENYIPAQINLASLQILNGDYFEAEYLCRKSLRHMDAEQDVRQLSSIYNNLALIYALQDDKHKALEYMDISMSHNMNSINAYNKSVINDETNELIVTKTNKLKCVIDDVDLETLFSKIMQEEETADLSVEIDKASHFYRIGKDHSEIFVSFLDWGDSGYAFIQRGDRINIEGEEYNTGTHIDDMQVVLGEPDQVLNALNTSLYNYKTHRVNLTVNQDGHVIEFFVYKNEN